MARRYPVVQGEFEEGNEVLIMLRSGYNRT